LEKYAERKLDTISISCYRLTRCSFNDNKEVTPQVNLYGYASDLNIWPLPTFFHHLTPPWVRTTSLAFRRETGEEQMGVGVVVSALVMEKLLSLLLISYGYTRGARSPRIWTGFGGLTDFDPKSRSQPSAKKV
jgi:hypothetical protein